MTNIVLLDTIAHADLRVATGYAAGFGDAVNQCVVFPTEFDAVQRVPQAVAIAPAPCMTRILGPPRAQLLDIVDTVLREPRGHLRADPGDGGQRQFV